MANLIERLTRLHAVLSRGMRAGDFADVLSRRRRRVFRRTAYSAVSAAALVGVIVVVLAGMPGVGGTDTVLPGGPAPSWAPQGGTEPLQPGAIDFVDDQHGTLLGQRCVPAGCQAFAQSTGDGGVTWSAPVVVGTSTEAADDSGTPVADHLLRSDRNNGFAWGQSLFRTFDGGRSWHAAKLKHPVAAVAAAGGTVWVAQRSGPLLAGPVDHDTLIPATVQPPTNGDPVDALVRPDVGTAYLVLGEDGGGPHRLVATTDGGRHWSERADPCGVDTAESLSTADANTLWLLCANMAGAGNEGKRLFVSSNGARGWLTRPEPATNGYGSQLVAVSASEAWRFGAQSDVLRSTDSGKSWDASLTAFTAGAPPIFFALDATHAWAISSATRVPPVPPTVYRTTDGVSWTNLSAPTAKRHSPPEVPTPTAAAVARSPFRSNAIAFADRKHGIVLGSSCAAASCHDQTFTSTDGGANWSAYPAFDSYPASDLDQPAGGGPSGGARSLTVRDASTAWAWGPGLFRTGDGGRSWRRVVVSDPVASVTLVGHSVWVLTQHCDANGGNCSARLLTGPTSGGVLAAAPVQPPLGTTGIASRGSDVIGQAAAIVDGDADTAYAVSLVETSSGRGARVISTTDGGTHWTRRTDPCNVGAFGQFLSADSDTDLWLLCAGEPSAGNQEKRLYRSLDGGRSWQQQPNPNGSGYGVYLTAISANMAWRYGDRSPVLRTVDGGRSWQPSVPDFAIADGATPFAGLDTTHAWAVAPGPTPSGSSETSVEQVWRTIDGVDWLESALTP